MHDHLGAETESRPALISVKTCAPTHRRVI
jgi:hypothetical protein